MALFKSHMKLTREEMKELFREHDIDGDGVLSMSEITQVFSLLGNRLPYYKAHYGLSFADEDGDGLITEDELDKLVDYAMRFQNPKGHLASKSHAGKPHAGNSFDGKSIE